MKIDISPIAQSDSASFRDCLNQVAQERRFLAFLEAPSLAHMKLFVNDGLSKGDPRVVAKLEGRVIGFCDIQSGWPETKRHCGTLGMGVLKDFRGQGIGHQLLENCLTLARQAGITRVELEVRSDNQTAINLYKRMGFEVEGIRPRGMRVEGEYQETTAMALLL